MTPEAQRIAIAEACGWKRLDISSYGPLPYWDDPSGVYVGGGSWTPIPDYLNSLDAMHEAEKVLPKNRLEIYTSWLRVGKASGGSPAELYRWHATAAQRAEAFLRCLNLWRD